MTAGAVVVAIAAVLLLALGVLTRRPLAQPVPDLDGYFARWQQLHGGYDMRTGSRIARGWLTGVYALCRPLAGAGVQPDVVTLVSVEVCGVAAVLAAGSGRLPLLAGVVVTLGAALDNADGCVAVLTGRVTRWGYLLDSLADRVSDVLVLLALRAAGGSGAVCVAAGGVLFLLEYLRARAVGAGVDDVGVVSIGERPGRLIVAIFALLAAGVLPAHAADLATVGAAATLGLAAVGLLQVGTAVRARLR